MAAELYAETRCPFEEVALKFVQAEARIALKQYLLAKLQNTKKEVSALSHSHRAWRRAR
jgi:hypothetical protein